MSATAFLKALGSFDPGTLLNKTRLEYHDSINCPDCMKPPRTVWPEFRGTVLDAISDDVFRSVKFRIDDGLIDFTGERTDESAIAPRVRLPFPVTLLEFGGTSVLLKDTGDGIYIQSHHQDYAAWPFNHFILDDNTLKLRIVGDCRAMTSLLAEEFDGSVTRLGAALISAHVLAILNCSNVSTVIHHPSAKENRRRIAAGKVPFFSYRTLHVEASNRTTHLYVDGQGSHASPRLHLRRGHIRRLDELRTTWVSSCMVGDASLGFAAKGYRLENA